MPDPDLGVEVLVCFILLRGVTHRELVGLRFSALREAFEERNESLLFDLGISLTIERFRLLV